MGSYECPACHRPLMGPNETCGGSFTEADHPSAVKAVPAMTEQKASDTERTPQRFEFEAPDHPGDTWRMVKRGDGAFMRHADHLSALQKEKAARQAAEAINRSGCIHSKHDPECAHCQMHGAFLKEKAEREVVERKLREIAESFIPDPSSPNGWKTYGGPVATLDFIRRLTRHEPNRGEPK